ncbi:TPA: 50S ribosomal protein L10 [Candidatus Bathyarchaeota archaeon]|nr:50S ribosomal protein L10 [Candidatus Bathyarchaeota archaeon]
MQVEIHPKKKEMVESVIERLEKYDAVAVVDLTGVRAPQIHEFRRKLRGKVEFLVTKNTIFRKAAERLSNKKRGIVKLAESLRGSNLFLFTDMSPFSLSILLNKSKVKVAAKAGDVATSDIVVPAGNTGLPPGPIISEFGKLKIPTRIESGSIWIASDTLVAKKGEAISADLASLLSRLGIKPIEAGLSLKLAYQDGLLFTEKDLSVDLEELEGGLKLAASHALNLSVNVGYLTPETAPLILGKAHAQAFALAIEAEYPMKEVLSRALSLAHSRAAALSKMAGFEEGG